MAQVLGSKKISILPLEVSLFGVFFFFLHYADWVLASALQIFNMHEIDVAVTK